MWFIHLDLVAVALYAAVIAGMYFTRSWLLFPTTLVAGHFALPTSAQRLKVETHSHKLFALGVLFLGLARGDILLLVISLLGLTAHDCEERHQGFTLERIRPPAPRTHHREV